MDRRLDLTTLTGGIPPEVRPFSLDRAVEEGGDPLVDLTA
jgi:hypothetical protein